MHEGIYPRMDYWLGQLDDADRLEGVGRKVVIYSDGGRIQIWEGQFRKGKPCGFARFIEVSEDKKLDYCMGHWTDEN